MTIALFTPLISVINNNLMFSDDNHNIIHNKTIFQK